MRELIRQMSDSQKENQADPFFFENRIIPNFCASKKNSFILVAARRTPHSYHCRKMGYQQAKSYFLRKRRKSVIKKYSGLHALKKGAFGIEEPPEIFDWHSPIDLVIVPGVAFDKNKNRLGRGKGITTVF
jgi:5-formyltetrahydrofolate cyclo-ligase